jgi:hypothetical protein
MLCTEVLYDELFLKKLLKVQCEFNVKELLSYVGRPQYLVSILLLLY